jgi:hypothetical protein
MSESAIFLADFFNSIRSAIYGKETPLDVSPPKNVCYEPQQYMGDRAPQRAGNCAETAWGQMAPQ